MPAGTAAGRRRGRARSACGRSRSRPRRGSRRRPRTHAAGVGLPHAHPHGDRAVVQEALQTVAAAAQHAVHAGPPRQPEGPRRCELRLQLDQRTGRAGAVPASARRPGPPSRWTSTSSERLPTIWTSSPTPPAGVPATAESPPPLAPRERRGAPLALLHEAEHGRSRDEASGGGGGRLDRRRGRAVAAQQGVRAVGRWRLQLLAEDRDRVHELAVVDGSVSARRRGIPSLLTAGEV